MWMKAKLKWIIPIFICYIKITLHHVRNYKGQHLKEGHIKEGKPSEDPNHPDWKPSVFPHQKINEKRNKSKVARYNRLQGRQKVLNKLTTEAIRKVTGQKRPDSQALKPVELKFEPEIIIKEEPIDIDEEPLPSTSTANLDFILPITSTTPWVTTLQPVTAPENAMNTGENGRVKRMPKKKVKKEAKEPATPEKKPEEEPTVTDSQRVKDHFDVYGEYIAVTLRKLDWKSCAYVQKAIGDILFNAEMGKYK